MSSTKPSPKFFHDHPDAKTLLATLATDRDYEAAIVEKDYWVMHCLWGLQQNGLRFEMKGGTSLSKGWGVIDRFSEDIDIRFDPPPGLNLKNDAEKHVKARRAFYDELAGKIAIPGITVERNARLCLRYSRDQGLNHIHIPIPTKSREPAFCR